MRVTASVTGKFLPLPNGHVISGCDNNLCLLRSDGSREATFAVSGVNKILIKIEKPFVL
jgi:hypothetical protein